jgi:hypothetical protein
MDYHGSLTRTNFENALTPGSLQITRIMQLALMIGVLIYSLCVFVIYLQYRDLRADAYAVDIVSMLTLIHLAFLGGALVLGQLLSLRIFSPQGLPAALSEADTRRLAEQVVLRQRTAIIVRLAAIDGAAFFGLAICTVGAINGTLQNAPLYWVNMLSTIVLLVFGAVTFPTRERLVGWFERSFTPS